TIARIRPRNSFKLLVLAGGDFAPFKADVQRLGIEDRVIVREKVTDIEDYLQAADIGIFTSEMESFCLSILEAMCFGCPSIAVRVGGIPEVIEDRETGRLLLDANAEALARTVEELIQNPNLRQTLGSAAKKRAREKFSVNAIVPQYEALYQRVCSNPVAAP